MISVYAILILIILTGIAIGRIPRFRMNRATIGLVGVFLLVVTGAISREEAFKAIELNTILLLFSMMIINANLAFAGFFNMVTVFILKRIRTARQMLLAIIFTAGILSALFLNDTIAIMMTPYVVILMQKIKRNPLPYLIALAIATNLGSAFTPIGNPQNMLIAISSGLNFMYFVSHLMIPSVINLFVLFLLILLIYPTEFLKNNAFPEASQFESYTHPRIHRPLLWKSTIVSVGLLFFLLLGFPISWSAFGGASILLFTRRIKPEKVFREIDWGLLVFFSALFIITHSIRSSGLFDIIFPYFSGILTATPAHFSLIVIILSNLISNVPAVLVLSPFIGSVPQSNLFWLMLAMISTYAGNLTLLGSVANLIVAEIARRYGIEISFMEYLKTGAIITLISSVIGIIYLMVTF